MLLIELLDIAKKQNINHKEMKMIFDDLYT